MIPPTSIHLELTREFNAGRLRAVLCGGQAVVLHRLAIMSKDGDWILREDEEALAHVLGVLGRRGARYRFGAPLDVRWLSGGWSSHLEFQEGGLRVRTDFFTRPPRIPPEDLERLWREQEGRDPAFADAPALARMKMTDRERDWAVIGELARIMPAIEDQLLTSRSPEDLQQIARQYPELVAKLTARRPLLGEICDDHRTLQARLDAERYEAKLADRRRLAAYEEAARKWADAWTQLHRRTDLLPTAEAHRLMVLAAERTLPTRVGGA